MSRRLVTCFVVVCVLVSASSAPLAGSVAASVPLLPGSDPTTPAPYGQVSRAGGHVVSAERVHDRGITGGDVAVGVIGASFEPAASSIRDQVAGHRRAPETAENGGIAVGPRRHVDSHHDTAVAAVVAETAPDTELYLAAVGDDPTPEEYEAAVEWLVANDVTVIVDAGSYFASDPETNERITAVAERAAANGTLFVTSAGNYANSQWVGAGPAEGWVNFSNETEGNRLAGGNVTGGTVSLRLTWNTSADYDLYLYRAREGGPDPVVAKSVRRQNASNASNDSAQSWETIDASVPRGRYYVAIDAHDGSNGSQLRLLSSRQSLEHAVSNGSVVAPATGERIIAVGAIDADSGRVTEYSSRGRASVDVWGPATVRTESWSLEGTSAAAPYVAGTAALVASASCDEHISSEEMVGLLRASAADNTQHRPGSVVAAKAIEQVERKNGTTACYTPE